MYAEAVRAHQELMAEFRKDCDGMEVSSEGQITVDETDGKIYVKLWA